MLSLPVTFLEDWELFNGLVSRSSGPESRQLREYRERTDSILKEIQTSFSGQPSSTSQSSEDISTKRSCPATEDRSYPLSPSLASALTSLGKHHGVQSMGGRQGKRRKVEESLVRTKNSGGGHSRLDNTIHTGEDSNQAGNSLWRRGVNLVGDVFSFIIG